MKITVKFFAIARELAGTGEIHLEVSSNATAGAALSSVIERFPELGKWHSRLALAVNRSYVQPDHCLQDGDELALIPPVSGG